MFIINSIKIGIVNPLYVSLKTHLYENITIVENKVV